jgi:drug/metabolite transporter (DMT)-like permease
MDKAEKQITFTSMIPVFIVYIVWGSTYLAIRFVAREGSGFPPFAAASSRYLVAGGAIWLWGLLSGRQLKPTKKDWTTLVLAGVLMMAGGNGMVTWAEQQADSSLAALLVGAVPIWTIVIETILNRRWPSAFLIGSVLVGFGGITLLALPGMRSGEPAQALSILALLFAGFSWSLGGVRQNRNPVTLDPIISSGYQMLAGGVALLVISVFNREPLPAPQTDAWIAWGYLVVFGSILAFTAFVTALKNLPIQVVMTYTYVNPVIAVFLGWLVLDEYITGWTIGGTVLVLLGVWGVFRERGRVKAASNNSE